MTRHETRLPKKSTDADVSDFLQRVAATPPPAKHASEKGRLIFAMDATASREPSWDRACQIQADMFDRTSQLGGLNIQLCYYRGFRQFTHSGWLGCPDELLKQMTGVRCAGGMTQIERVLEHAIAEISKGRVEALVFVGDCVEEDPERLVQLAGGLGLRGLRAFMFQEGIDQLASATFGRIARVTGGAHCRFDGGSAQALADLLGAVAVYAAGGRKALAHYSAKNTQLVKALIHQIDNPPK